MHSENLIQKSVIRKCVWLTMFSILGISSQGLAQQINVATPFGGASDSYFENFRVNFGFSIPGGQGPGSRVVGYNGFGITPNINFSQGGFGSTIPAFGGYSPNTGGRFGFASLNGSGGGFSLGFELAQGSTRTLTSTTPSVTLMNGGFGVISSGAISPFVTGVIPVVGSDVPMDNGVTRGIASGQLRPYSENRAAESSSNHTLTEPSVSNENSTANQGAASVVQIKADLAEARASRSKMLKQNIATAQKAHGRGDYRNARIALRKAMKLADDDAQLSELKNWMKTLRGK